MEISVKLKHTTNILQHEFKGLREALICRPKRQHEVSEVSVEHLVHVVVATPFYRFMMYMFLRISWSKKQEERKQILYCNNWHKTSIKVWVQNLRDLEVQCSDLRITKLWKQKQIDCFSIFADSSKCLIQNNLFHDRCPEFDHTRGIANGTDHIFDQNTIP